MADQTDIDDIDDLDRPQLASLMMGEVRRAKKYFDRWNRQAKRIVKRYRDDPSNSVSDVQSKAKFNILWSNVQTTLPALYANPPVAIVQRRYLDRDPVGRMAAQMLQRCLAYHIDDGDLHAVVRLCVEDMLVVGRGTAWVRYEPVIEQTLEVNPMTGIPQPVEKITREKACVDYVHWTDFLHGPARTWDEVPWVAKRAYMSHDELEERFGEDIANRVPMLAGPQNGQEASEDTPHELKRAIVWEIWVKSDKRVVWVAEGMEDEPLDVKDDPLQLTGFFPCPEPIYATLSTDSLIPIPDYQQYAAQAVEMDELSARIDKLIQSVRVTGVYDSSIPEIARIFTEQSDNRLIPAQNWSAFSNSGGFKGAVDYMPIEQNVSALKSLYEARQAVKQDIYEITGISDILRGATAASETATAQRIKGQWGTIRLKDRQTQIADFVRALLRIQGEIISEHFQPETIITISGAQEMEGFNPEVAMQAIMLLRDDKMRGFRIDIETDSTIAADEQAEKQARIEFLTAVGGFLQQALPAVQTYPAIAPLLGKMLLFGVRGFRAGNELEGAFEEAIGQMNAQQGQNPQQMAAAKQKEEEDAAHQLEARKIDLEEKRLMLDAEKAKAEFSLKQREIEHKSSAQEPAKAHVLDAVQNLNSATAQIGEMSGQIVAQVAQMAAFLQQMQADTQANAQAPRRIVRDPSGKAVGVEVNGNVRMVERDPNGRVIGLQ